MSTGLGRKMLMLLFCCGGEGQKGDEKNKESGFHGGYLIASIS
jgi:hypothetical protein